MVNEKRGRSTRSGSSTQADYLLSHAYKKKVNKSK